MMAAAWLLGIALAAPVPEAQRGPFTLRFEPTTQRLSLSDARTGLTWSSDAPALAIHLDGAEVTAGRVEASALPGGEGLRVHLSELGPGSRAAVTFEARLGDEGVRVRLLPLDGYVPLYGAVPATLDAEGKRIIEETAGAQLAEMLDHCFLAEGVEQTVFADGTRVTANFRDEAYQGIPAHGYQMARGIR